MDFGVFSPKLNTRQDVPSILLSEAFIQADSRNVFEQHGEYKSLRGRLDSFLDASGDKIATPTDVYVITSIVSGSKTINITGDHSAGNTVLAVGAAIRINGGSANETTFTVASLPTTSSIVVTETLSADATPGNLFVGTTPIIRYHKHTKQKSGVEYLLAATIYHILLWSYANKALTVKFTSGTPSSVERWDILTHLDNVYATNNVDKVLKWDVRDDPANSFEVFGSASGVDIDGAGTFLTACKYLASYEGYLFLLYTTEGGGANNVKAQRGRWSSLRDDTDFNENSAGDAGSKDFDNTPAFIAGVGKKDGDIYVFTNGDRPVTYFGWLVTADTVFEWDEKQIRTGCIAPDTIVNDRSGRLFYLASDLTFREIDTPIALSFPVDISIRGINTEFAKFSQATYIDEFDHIYLAIPAGSSETNNLVLDLTIRNLTWNMHDIPIRAFGDYTRQEVQTYDTLPYPTYDDWGLAWKTYDTEINVIGFPLDLASDYNGCTFELHSAFNDAGSDYTRALVIGTTLTLRAASINLFKRVNNGVDLYFNREAAGDVNIFIKRDNEKSWQLAGVASLVDTDLPDIVVVHVPFDKRAKFFLIKLESTDYFEFLGMIFREFYFDDSR